MVDEATAAGELPAGTEIVLPSSGGTAIAMAEETRDREVSLTIFLPSTTPEGKIAVLKKYPHVQIIKVDGSSEDARGAAASYVMSHKAERSMWYADQYSDESAPRIHMRETAPEIVAQTGASVTHVFVGMGTGSTATGLALVLRRLDVEVIGVQPAASRHRLAGLKYYPDLPPHLVPGNARLELLSATEYISDEDGLTMMHKLVAHGLRFGPSTGANLAAAVRTAARLGGQSAIFVLIAHDSFELYADDTTYEVTK
jgi:cysteine synthase